MYNLANINLRAIRPIRVPIARKAISAIFQFLNLPRHLLQNIKMVLQVRSY